MRILVADDSATARLVMGQALSALGHECVLADDGVEAWERFQADPIEVVVSDWLMPRLNGDELCRRVRAHDGPYAYFVLLTGLGDTAHALDGMRAGADDFLTKPLDAHELEMRLIAAGRVTALHRRIREQQQALQREVELAASVQRRLLPNRVPTLPGLTLAGRCVPAADIGGDYYDHLVDEQGRVVALIADVAGHSIGSALLMAMARIVVRREIAEQSSPGQVLAAANRAMFADLAIAELFITMFCARYEPESGVLTFANAGHNPPLLSRAGGTVEWLDAEGAAVGIFPDERFEEGSVQLEAGDLLLLYTDGVVEAGDRGGVQFGERRLEQLVARRDGAEPGALLDAVYAAVRGHVSGAPQQDDVTLLALQSAGPASGGDDAS